MFEQAYGRLVCFADGQREIIAMQWKQGATCAIHDHGATASGRVHLVVGELVECVVVVRGPLQVLPQESATAGNGGGIHCGSEFEAFSPVVFPGGEGGND